MAIYGHISPRQLKRVQTLWSLFWKNIAGDQLEGCIGPGFLRLTERSARLAWIGGQIGRELLSCKDLTGPEAKTAIEALEKHLPKELVQRRAGRGYNQALGTAGRRGVNSKVVRPPDRRQLARIERLIGLLGWDQEKLKTWLRSAYGPLRGRAEIRTMGDANSVAWGLKRILKAEEGKKPNDARIETRANI